MAKTKVPKRIGGVKVPKKLRKQAKRAIGLVDSPAARELAIAGLALAAEALVERRGSRKSAKAAAAAALESGEACKRLGAAIKDGLDDLQLGEVLRHAAAEGARRFLEGFEEGRREARSGTAPAGKPRRRKANGRSAAAPAG